MFFCRFLSIISFLCAGVPPPPRITERIAAFPIVLAVDSPVLDALVASPWFSVLYVVWHTVLVLLLALGGLCASVSLFSLRASICVCVCFLRLLLLLALSLPVSSSFYSFLKIVLTILRAGVVSVSSAIGFYLLFSASIAFHVSRIETSLLLRLAIFKLVFFFSP